MKETPTPDYKTLYEESLLRIRALKRELWQLQYITLGSRILDIPNGVDIMEEITGKTTSEFEQEWQDETGPEEDPA
ncbi:hypothetical protein [Chitinophaga sp. Cy-1792]|uniref:hypothetical protein n=1 Tax=Chitinophaga sp. Cy-1792 TaxID=2608339 RepID=UPI0014220C61|nr:hypothetical protein [Chitinophaga sp. Cy-1792]NIG54900.1 hypothetical protein [Chitinophaga sp. Cy-1792]